MGFQTVGSIYKFPIPASAPGTAYAIPEIAQVAAMGLLPILSIECTTTIGAVFKVSNVNTVSASDLADATLKSLVSGNQHIAAGEVAAFKCLNSDAFFSLIAEDHTTTGGFLWVSVGYETRSNIN